jgi:hypothetical protein
MSFGLAPTASWEHLLMVVTEGEASILLSITSITLPVRHISILTSILISRKSIDRNCSIMFRRQRRHRRRLSGALCRRIHRRDILRLLAVSVRLTTSTTCRLVRPEVAVSAAAVITSPTLTA